MVWNQNNAWRGCDAYDKVGSSRKFGVELESSSCDGYEDWANDGVWGAKYDGSIAGKEFVSPPLHGNDGYDSVINFCGKAEDNGVTVDETCGYHLHLDLSDTNAAQRKSIALAYHYTREIWADFIAPDRRDAGYARFNVGSRHKERDNANARNGCSCDECRRMYGEPDTSPDYWNRDNIVGCNDINELGDGYTRYIWVNWRAFSVHRTVEIRSHEGTFDGRAVINWVKAHTKFVDYASKMTVGQITRVFGNQSKESIMKELRFVWQDADLHDYYTRKASCMVY